MENIANRRPHLIIVSGPNGSGKSTVFPALQNVETDGFPLAPANIKKENFVNPDNIANESRLNEIAAGRQTIEKIDRLITDGEDLAIETTFSGKTLSKHLDYAERNGYVIYIIFLCLQSSELSMNRVTQRALGGEHYIPLNRVLSRYDKSLKNFFQLYKNYANIWIVADNSSLTLKPMYWGGKYYKSDEIYCVSLKNNYMTKFIDSSRLSLNDDDDLLIHQFYKRVEPFIYKEINKPPKENYVVVQDKDSGKIKFVSKKKIK